MTYSELKDYINRWVETIKTPTRIDGYRLNLVLKELLDFANAAGSSDLLVGNILVVSDQGKTAAGGAIRESLTNHFSSIAEAWTAAQDNDLIIVMPGGYTVNTTFAGKDVDWFFMPGSSMNGAFSWSDSGITRNVRIGGYGDFSGTGNKFLITNASSNYIVDCENISTTNVTLQLEGGNHVFNVKDQILSSSGATLYINGGVSATINAKNIINTRVGNAVTTVNIRPTFTGSLIVNAEYIDNNPGATAANVIVWERVGSTGTAIFNVTNKITSLGSAPNACICVRGGGGLTFNGNIDGGAGRAIQITNEGGNVTHNGNATNNGTTTLVETVATGSSTLSLNGEYSSSNDHLITLNGAGTTVKVNGRYYNTNTAAVTKSVFRLQNYTALVVEHAIMTTDLTGTPYSYYSATIAKNVKLYTSISNTLKEVSVTNVITGSVDIEDNDVQ